MNTIEMNIVSECCHMPIILQTKLDSTPLGKHEYNGVGITYSEEVCESCGKDCSPVYACGVCGIVGCNGIGECEE